MKKLNLISLLILLIIGSCSTGKIQKTGDDSFVKPGLYEFMMMDSSGKILSEGSMEIQDTSHNRLKGVYKFDTVYVKFEGCTSMKGSFEGTINPSSMTVLIDTNPGTADDNVFFDLKIGEDVLKGTWFYSAFRKQEVNGNVILSKNK